MRYLKYAALLGVLVFALAGTAHAQVAVGVRVGPVGVAVGAPPVCAYGYYSYYPYACAPYGYYGPNWFVNGVFLGAGPWYHGYWGPHYGGPVYGRPGWGYRPGWGGGYHGAPVYHGGPVAHGYVGGGHNYGGSFHGGGFHGGGARGR